MQCNIKEYLFEEMQQITGLEVITPEQMMDYIYGVLNSPCYVEKFNDLLKQNYPRVAYPKDKEFFLNISELGMQLRLLHLSEVEKVSGTTILLKKPKHVEDKIILNDDYQIEGIDESLYNFKIGACPVIKNWLKARQDEEIILEELLLIINKCIETIRIRSELDKCWS
jgi:predicted helicase